MKLETTIPFPGFYNSELDELVNDEIRSSFDHEGRGSDNVPEEFWMAWSCEDVYPAIAKIYVKELEKWVNQEYDLNISMEWSIMTSPKEYNFQTDRVFVKMPRRNIKSLLRAVRRKHGADILDKKARERFTSRSGFISSYSNNPRDWPYQLAEWDHNQLGTILECLEIPPAYELLENATGNGLISNAVWDNVPEECLNLINNYREEATV